MRFSDELRRAAEPIWEAIFAHPLLQQLRHGSLPLESFQYFLWWISPEPQRGRWSGTRWAERF